MGEFPRNSRRSGARHLLFCAALTLPIWAGAQQVSSISGDRLRLTISQDSGAVTEFRDLGSGQNLARSEAGLWELQLGTTGGTVVVRPSQAGECAEDSVAALSRSLEWRGFAAPAPEGLKVRVTIELPKQSETARLRIEVEGLGANTLKQVRFPVLDGIASQKNEHLAVPAWMGLTRKDPRGIFSGGGGNGARHEWNYPGQLSMQCLAFWGDAAGLYLACDDTASFRKAFAVMSHSQGGLGTEVVHWPESSSAAQDRWQLPYSVLLGAFRGDWFTAAERYRSWATNQPWATTSRFSSGRAPAWILKTALWIWNRGRSEGVLDPAILMQNKLELPVSVFWHWWHGCAYDTGFPEYLPPREGSEAFQRAVAKARAQNVNALVYMNQRLWGMRTGSWTNENAAAWAVKGRDGGIHPEVYNTFTRAPCASMCLGTPFWRNKYAGLAERAVMELGVSGIYMDQACLSLSCFDPGHGHPVGGGTYWVNGFRLLAADIRQRCSANTGVSQPATARPALAGEGCGEPWLPHLDLMLSLQVSKERYAAPDGWEIIPFFHAVYHPHTILFGNYSSLTMPPYDDLWPAEFAPKQPLKLLDSKFSRQFCLEQARAFAWGQQPTLANFSTNQLRTRPDEIEYVLRLARLRNRALKYLLTGTMLRPPVIQVAAEKAPFSRLSIYAGQQGGLRTFEKEVPLALGSAWRAPDGKIALVIASISDRALPITIRIPAQDYGLATDGQIALKDMETDKITRVVPGANLLKLQMPRRGTSVLEFQ